MPEFVYGWFFPRVQTLARGNRAAMMAEAEENMWGFYYALKRDAKELPECRLFFTMLNETYGEDDLSFFLYCIQTVRGVARDDVSEAWGEEVIGSDDYATVLELEDRNGGLVEITERVWISVESAMYVLCCLCFCVPRAVSPNAVVALLASGLLGGLHCVAELHAQLALSPTLPYLWIGM